MWGSRISVSVPPWHLQFHKRNAVPAGKGDSHSRPPTITGSNHGAPGLSVGRIPVGIWSTLGGVACCRMELAKGMGGWAPVVYSSPRCDDYRLCEEAPPMCVGKG